MMYFVEILTLVFLALIQVTASGKVNHARVNEYSLDKGIGREILVREVAVTVTVTTIPDYCLTTNPSIVITGTVTPITSVPIPPATPTAASAVTTTEVKSTETAPAPLTMPTTVSALITTAPVTTVPIPTGTSVVGSITSGLASSGSLVPSSVVTKLSSITSVESSLNPVTSHTATRSTIAPNPTTPSNGGGKMDFNLLLIAIPAAASVLVFAV